jgi:hypothetical protein
MYWPQEFAICGTKVKDETNKSMIKIHLKYLNDKGCNSGYRRETLEKSSSRKTEGILKKQ